MNPETASLTDHQRHLEEVMLAYFRAMDAGEKPDPRDILTRHPELAAELQGFFGDEDQIRHAFEPIRPEIPLSGEGMSECGSCRLLERLDIGGMGVVYKGWQPPPLDRPVALKMIKRGEFASQDEVQRFMAEAGLAASLQHDHIVGVYEWGIHQGIGGTQPYFIMEFMEGGNLGGQLDRFRRDPKGAVRLLIPVARAVQHAHDRGIIHRDLKPANILLDEEGRPHVSDFGLARRLPAAHPPSDGPAGQTSGAEGSKAEHQSGGREIAGTLSYMAPEQARGNRDLTTAVDVYGLGAVLYTLLTGRPPFLKQEDYWETLKQIIEEVPDGPRKHNARVDRDLDAVCNKCLKKEPGQRYASAQALADDLQRWLEGRPVKARPVGSLKRTIKWTRRCPGIAALVLISVVLAGSGLGNFLYHHFQIKGLLYKEQVQANMYRVESAAAHLDAGQYTRGDQLLRECPEEFRHWEWHYLKRLIQRNQVVLRNHERPVSCVTFHPRDGRVVTGDTAGQLYLWNKADEQPSCRWPAHKGKVVSACFTEDGHWLITAGRDQKVQLWDFTAPLGEGHPPGPPITWAGLAGSRAVVSHEAPVRLATLNESTNEVVIWDLEKREVLARVKGPRTLTDLALSPDGRYLALCGLGGLVAVTRVEDTEWKLPLDLPADVSAKNMWAVAFSPDGKLVAAGTSPPTIWEVETGKRVGSYFGTANLISSRLTFSRPVPNRPPLIAAAYRDGLVRVWEVGSGKILVAPPKEPGMTYDIAFDPRGHSLAITRGKEVALETLRSDVVRSQKLPGVPPGRSFAAVAYSPDGRYVAARAGSHDVFVWQVARGKSAAPQLLHWLEMEAEADPRANLAFDPTGRVLACGSEGKRLLVWDVLSGKVVGKIPAAQVRCLGIRGDGQILATTDGGPKVSLWDLSTGKPAGTLSCTGGITALAFRPNSGQLVACGQNGSMDLWDTNTRKRLHAIPPGYVGANSDDETMRGHTSAITCIAFRPDGAHFATAGMDMRVVIWDSDTGEPAGTQPIYLVGPTFNLAYTPKGHRIAFGDRDGNVMLLDPHSGLEVLTLTDHEGPTTGIAFGPEGWLATCGHDGTVRLWDGRDAP